MKLAAIWHNSRIQATCQLLQLSISMLISTPLFLLALLLILQLWR